MKVNDLVEAFPYLLNKYDSNLGRYLDPTEAEESYMISWKNLEVSKILELPTGGASIMRHGENCICFARKEQCLAMAKVLRVKFKILDYRIARTFPNGESQHLHPKDGIAPEKVNSGRVPVGVEA